MELVLKFGILTIIIKSYW